MGFDRKLCLNAFNVGQQFWLSTAARLGGKLLGVERRPGGLGLALRVTLSLAPGIKGAVFGFGFAEGHAPGLPPSPSQRVRDLPRHSQMVS